MPEWPLGRAPIPDWALELPRRWRCRAFASPATQWDWTYEPASRRSTTAGGLSAVDPVSENLMTKKQVLVVGLDPSLVDFSMIPDMDAEKVRAGLEADKARLASLGYEAELCLTDLGDTAADVVARKLAAQAVDCVVIGAGIRTIPAYFLLFERLVNVVHQEAPGAKICFNTKPSDTVEAVQRWV